MTSSGLVTNYGLLEPGMEASRAINSIDFKRALESFNSKKTSRESREWLRISEVNQTDDSRPLA
jgi:hypothetical protein